MKSSLNNMLSLQINLQLGNSSKHFSKYVLADYKGEKTHFYEKNNKTTQTLFHSNKDTYYPTDEISTKVGRYTGILSYSRYLVDTGMAVLVLTLYRYTVIGGIL